MNHKLQISSLTFSVLLTIQAFAQDTSPLVNFTNGEIANADDMNGNFDNLNSRLKAIEDFGGCSAAQDGSSVVITCADGSSGVLASAGTVVVYPEGITGNADPITYNTGDIVVVDASDQVLGVVVDQLNAGSEFHAYYIELSVNEYSLKPLLYGQQSTQTVRLIPEGGGGSWTTVYWLTDDCTGPVWVAPRKGEYQNLLANLGDGRYFAPDIGASEEQLLFNSRIVSEHMHYSASIGWVAATSCEAGQYVANAWRSVEYILAPEIENAAYPITLKQLP
jgi:hypothetical protein